MHFSNLNSDELGAPSHLFKKLELKMSGSLVALTGPNGGGKSTLLQVLNQRCVDEAVDVIYGGQHPDDAALSEGQIQSFRWLDWMDRFKPGSVLLLDEPFRHLDVNFRFKALNFLKEVPGYKLIVSHDLDFLYQVDEILHLQNGILTSYGGNYDTYILQRQHQSAARERKITSLDATIRRAEKSSREILNRQAHRTRKAQKDNLTQNIPRSLINRQKNRAQKTEARLDKHNKRKVKQNTHTREQARLELLSLGRSKDGIVSIPAGDSRRAALEISGFEGFQRTSVSTSPTNNGNFAEYRSNRESAGLTRPGRKETAREVPGAIVSSGKAEARQSARDKENVSRTSAKAKERPEMQSLFPFTLSFRLLPGQRMWIRGSNGCGKTTFLETMLQRWVGRGPTGQNECTIHFGGRVFYLPQNLPFRQSLSLEAAFEELWETTSGGPLPASEIRSQWRTLLGYSGIGGDVKRPLDSYSGGERMRILLCLAALMEPAILILDEPEQNLDLVAREELLRTLNDYRGAILFVTHDHAFAAHLMPNQILDFDSGTISNL
tara:strand:- start:302854 stop:304503 length:1650 start_codon:yes stop_codon:yes gene_type:complete